MPRVNALSRLRIEHRLIVLSIDCLRHNVKLNIWKGDIFMWSEFKKFAMRGNVIDIAVGIIVGIAFGAIVNSLVADVVMPPIGLILGKVDFSNLSITLSKSSGVTINYGKFINTIINFLIVAFAVFMLVRGMNKLMAKDKVPAPLPTTKECPFCISTISIKAVKCPNCTSDLKK
jgi:large conductance mechanosensitive channel